MAYFVLKIKNRVTKWWLRKFVPNVFIEKALRVHYNFLIGNLRIILLELYSVLFYCFNFIPPILK